LIDNDEIPHKEQLKKVHKKKNTSSVLFLFINGTEQSRTAVQISYLPIAHSQV